MSSPYTLIADIILVAFFCASPIIGILLSSIMMFPSIVLLFVKIPSIAIGTLFMSVLGIILFLISRVAPSAMYSPFDTFINP